NYRTPSGTWQPIDDSLVSSSGGFTNRADSYSLSLPATLGSGAVRVSDSSGNSLAMRIQGASAGASAAVSGSEASYAEAFPGVGVSYTSASGVLREAFSFSGPSVAPITTTVVLSPGLHAVLNDGTVRVEDANGATKFVMPTPFMTDAPVSAKSPFP